MNVFVLSDLDYKIQDLNDLSKAVDVLKNLTIFSIIIFDELNVL